MNGKGFKTPLLRLFSAYFHYFGAPQRELRFDKRSSVLNYAYNACLNLFILYGIWMHDPFELDSIGRVCSSNKPLYRFFVKFLLIYVYPAVFLTSSCFFMKNGWKVTTLLDAKCFAQFYQSKKTARRVFCVVILVNHAFFFGFVSSKIDHMVLSLAHRSPFSVAIGNFCVYFVCMYNYINCHILNYYQYATLHILRDIQRQLSCKVMTMEEDQAMDNIMALAASNAALNHMLSLPLAIFVVLNVFNLILTASMIALCDYNFGLLFHGSFTMFYLGYLVWLNQKVLDTFACIVAQMRAHYRLEHSSMASSASSSGGRLFRQVLYKRNNGGTYLRSNSVLAYDSDESRQMRFCEIEIYRKYFAVRVFRICVMNLPFLFEIILFGLNYIVFILQTN